MSYNKAEHSLPPAEGAEEPCKCCDGTGVCEDIGGEKGACMTCNGSGKWKWQQPTAEGAETIQPHITCPKCSSTNNSELAKNNRLCYDCNHSWSEQQPKLDPKKVQWSGYGELGNISQKPLQPTAEGAEEINKMIGQTKDSISKRYNKNYWEILGDYHSNGRLTTNDFIDELLNEFATLHAQKIADKMVSERLREELLKFVTWYDTYDGAIQMIAVDNYLKSRE